MGKIADIVKIKAGVELPADRYGARANKLSELMTAGFDVPPSFAVSVGAVSKIAVGQLPDLSMLENAFTDGTLYSIRRSPEDREWGGPVSLLNIGMNFETRDILADRIGLNSANDFFCRLIRSYGVQVGRLDDEDIEEVMDRVIGQDGSDYAALLDALLTFYEDELGEPFPLDPKVQLSEALKAMARLWGGTTARILRQARGAPVDAGLGLIIQDMVVSAGSSESGLGIGQFVNWATGEPGAHGRYHPLSLGLSLNAAQKHKLYLADDSRGPSLETEAPDVFAKVKSVAADIRTAFREDMELQFKTQDGKVWILDVKPAERSGRGEVSLVVRLVEDGLCSIENALLAVAPGSLSEMLHRQVDPKAETTCIATGIAASPGAATGKLVFSSTAAQASAAREENCILIRQETTPEDIRGMQLAQGVLTERGGVTSHAAVIARGLGLPCIVGANELQLDLRKKTVTLPSGETLKEGATVTIDGTSGEVLAGAPHLLDADLGGDFDTFMDWADKHRRLGVRANVDTPTDARLAQSFKVDGVGLCRTEHMFFEPGRLTAMREMIFADQDVERQAALDRLLPMQRDDFVEMFEVMAGQPVCIRLLDPPLHEFLPQSREEMRTLSDAMDLSLPRVIDLAEDLAETNPMLGLRGVRVGITEPMIYDMQARAIFEAASVVQKKTGVKIHPEIMVPLVSANREVALVKDRVDTVADEVQRATGQNIEYSVGVMVETPRAAIKAGEIAEFSEFMSFGTNDLTQMTYGLSRDDAGRFMREYVNLGVFSEDPFNSIDLDAVGELVMLAVARAKARRPNVGLGLCGEHGGDPQSVAFCHRTGLDYVSCSAYRTPIARLAAAQAAILDGVE